MQNQPKQKKIFFTELLVLLDELGLIETLYLNKIEDKTITIINNLNETIFSSKCSFEIKNELIKISNSNSSNIISN